MRHDRKREQRTFEIHQSANVRCPHFGFAWDAAAQRYDSYLQSILPQLSPAVRQLLDGYYLHDAAVLSAGRQGDTFLILLQLDVPPNDLLSITYTLTAEPRIDRAALRTEHRSLRMTWQYEELEMLDSGEGRHYRQTILFSNGWEIQLPFRDVRLATVQPIYPCPRQAAPSPIAGAPLG